MAALIKDLEKLSIGVDIENIDRFKKLNFQKNRLFLEKIFTKKELEYCFSKKNHAQHLAARFTGKEAVIKALSDRIKRDRLKISHNEIEILNDKNGAPKINLKNPDFEGNIRISLSHSKDKAMAFAILIGY